MTFDEIMRANAFADYRDINDIANQEYYRPAEPKK